MHTNLEPRYLLAVLLSIVVSLAVHEFMHAYAGHVLGDKTAQMEGRLTLNPLAHIDPFMTVLLPVVTLLFFGAPVLAAKPVPFNPESVKYGDYGAAILAAAGPLSNLAMAFVSALIMHAATLSTGSGFGYFLNIFTILNVALFVFNFVPIPPLDGSRVLYAFSPEPLRQLLEDIEPYGLFIVILLVFAGNFGNVLVNINQFFLNLLP